MTWLGIPAEERSADAGLACCFLLSKLQPTANAQTINRTRRARTHTVGPRGSGRSSTIRSWFQDPWSPLLTADCWLALFSLTADPHGVNRLTALNAGR